MTHLFINLIYIHEEDNHYENYREKIHNVPLNYIGAVELKHRLYADEKVCNEASI